LAKKRSGANRAKSAAANVAKDPARIPLVSVWAVGAFLAAIAISAATPGEAFGDDVYRYWTGGTILVAIGAAVIAWLPQSSLRALPERCAQLLTRPSPAAFAAVIGVGTIVLCLAAALYAYTLHAIAADELAQLWHAKILASGRLSLPADPNPEFFAIDNVIDTGRWYSQFPIGGPAVLALGVLIGAPWLVNPLLAGATSVAIYHFARNAYGEVEGRAITALFAVTPVFLLMSGSHMNHVPTLFLMSVAMAGLVELDRDTPRIQPLVVTAIIGFTIGAMATIRPLDAAVAAVVTGAFQVTLMARGRLRLQELAMQAATGTLAVVPLLYANWATTGSALRFGYNVMWGAAHQIGFHVDPTGAEHTPTRALAYAVRYVNDLNLFVEAWPVPGLVFAMATLLMLRRVTRWDAFLLGLFWTQVFAYALYWHRGQFIGPRFLYTALPAIVVFIARGPFATGDRFGAFGRRFALAAVLLCIGGSWLYDRYQGAFGIVTNLRLTRGLFKADIAGAASDSGLHNALVFVNEPFVYRLHRRLWGLGVDRRDAVTLISNGDACSLLSAIVASEKDSVTPRERRTAAIARATDRYIPGPAVVPSTSSLHYNSEASFTEQCRREVGNDTKFGVATFGPALLNETIGADGRLAGDVVYAADLGDRNEVLRARFGSRTWYRLSVQRPGDNSYHVVIRPY
jgi:hypothetical protein